MPKCQLPKTLAWLVNSPFIDSFIISLMACPPTRANKFICTFIKYTCNYYVNKYNSHLSAIMFMWSISLGWQTTPELVIVMVTWPSSKLWGHHHIFGLTDLKFHVSHTQPFYCSSGICPGPPGWAGTRTVKPGRLKPMWIYWSKR